MKTSKMLALYFLLVASSLSLAQEPRTIEEIVKARKALLTQILEAKTIAYDNANGSDVELHDAAFELYAFCRDSTKSTPERIQWQEKIMAIEQKAKARAEKRAKAGEVSPDEVLRAEEHVLAAKQTLLEFQAKN